MARNKWKTTDMVERIFTSEAKAYAYVNAARASFLAGTSGVATVVVWVLEGERWRPFDSHDFAAGE